MPVKSYRPTSPAVRNMTVADFSGLTKKEPEKSLLRSKSHQAGRNSYGRITVRHHGGGNKSKIRIIAAKTLFRQELKLWSTIRVAQLTLLYCITQMAPRATFWHLPA